MGRGCRMDNQTLHVGNIGKIKGKVAVQPAWPKERGGGVQFYFPDKANYKTVRYYAELGLLRRLEVEEWSPVIAEDMEHS